MENPVEALIVVNGTTLNIGQSLTVRVALEHFAMWLDREGQDLGEPLRENYLARATEVLREIHK